MRRIAQDDALAPGDRARRVRMPRLVAAEAAFAVVAVTVFRPVEVEVLASADTLSLEAALRKARRRRLPAWR